jgi:hypothetical protein
MTKNMMELIKAMGSLRADGNTALFDSIVFSILQLRGGRRPARDRAAHRRRGLQEPFSAHQAGLQARRRACPVYFLSLAGWTGCGRR